ncbi:hypothetical protein C4K25_1499 [Pseudomonas chlororaphis]|nr:hypothetical protein C4K25_1499 [Pseudomonas chlororaphis]
MQFCANSEGGRPFNRKIAIARALSLGNTLALLKKGPLNGLLKGVAP